MENLNYYIHEWSRYYDEQYFRMDKIAILDAGSQYIKLIDLNIRELNCYTDVIPLNVPAKQLLNYKGIIISGGPDSVYHENAIKCDPKIFELNIPVLGICYGLQLLNLMFGGTVIQKLIREDGRKQIKIISESKLFGKMENNQKVLLTHGDSIDKIANNFKITAMSDDCISAIEHETLPLYGVQFHPEVELTENGKQIFSNFLMDICHAEPTYTMQNRLDGLLTVIRETVGNKKVIMLVSGGVDSTVCLALLHQALNKDQIHSVHIDHGFLRKKDGDVIKKLNDMGYCINILDRKAIFRNSKTKIDCIETNELCFIMEPEQKRKIIGDCFIKVIDGYFEELNLKQEDCLLVQGTLRPDLIESASKLASGKADTIKTHHNDTKLVREMRDKGLILEPLKDLHKNEVRKIGICLGLDHSLIYRHPFPGPGLAIRIICTPKLDLNEYDAARYSLISYKKIMNINDYELTALPFKSVGIQGDCRTYSFAVSISGKYDDKIYEYALDIPQKIKTINRVLYMISDFDCDFKLANVKLCNEDVTLLKEVDSHITDMLSSTPIYDSISQMPVILLPFGRNGKKSIVLRPIVTGDFMTALPYKISFEVLEKIREFITTQFEEISHVFVDLTSKPPGTIEYE